MKSKRNLIVLSAFIIVMATYSSLAMAQNDLFSQLVAASKVEVAKKNGKLVVAFPWPKRQARPVLAAFKKDFPFVKKITYARSRKVSQAQKMLMEYTGGGTPSFDIPYINNEMWPAFKKQGVFVKPPFSYVELSKSLPQGWPKVDPRNMDPEGYYLSVSASLRGIAYNTKLVPANQAPKGWEDCLDPKWKGKIIYDPRARLAAFQHDPKTRDWYLKWLKGLMANGVVLNRGMGDNMEKLASGEFSINCVANYHHAIPMAMRGAPVAFVMADPIAMNLSTMLYIVKWAKVPATTQLLSLWLATKGQTLIEKVSHRGFPWDPKSRKYPMAKGKYIALCASVCRADGDKYAAEHAKILRLPGVR